MLTRLTGLLTPIALLAALAAVPTATAASSKFCKLSTHEQRSMGPSYVATPIRVTHMSCASGKAVVRAFHRCRREHGVLGRCSRRVRGFRCTEKRGTQIPTESSGNKVTCRRDRAVVESFWTQLL